MSDLIDSNDPIRSLFEELGGSDALIDLLEWYF